MQLIRVMIIRVMLRPGNARESSMATGTTLGISAVAMRVLKTVKTAKHV